MKNSRPRVALIYDRINTRYGGAEKLLCAVQDIFPEATVLTSVYDPQNAIWADKMKVVTSFLQRVPWSAKLYRYLVWLMPLAFESLDCSEFDLIISLTSAEAKGVVTNSDQLHICYLLSPPRYLWSYRDQYHKNRLINFLSQVLHPYLSWWDKSAAFRPDIIIPISKLSSERSLSIYNRATLDPIYPTLYKILPTPQIEPFSSKKNALNFHPKNKVTLRKILHSLPKKYYLVVSRLVPYKGIERVIEAIQVLGLSLVIVGEGPEKNFLERLVTKLNPSSVNQIRFLGSVTDQDLSLLYQNCESLIMAGEDDFGLTALESWHYGKPVILNSRSGVSELSGGCPQSCILVDGSVSSLVSALTSFNPLEHNQSKIQRWAQKYDTLAFSTQFREKIHELWRTFLSERPL